MSQLQRSMVSNPRAEEVASELPFTAEAQALAGRMEHVARGGSQGQAETRAGGADGAPHSAEPGEQPGATEGGLAAGPALPTGRGGWLP